MFEYPYLTKPKEGDPSMPLEDIKSGCLQFRLIRHYLRGGDIY
jgi:hypothetical protein